MIYKRTIRETVKIKELFDSIGIADEEHANHFPIFDIRVKTPYGYNRINELFRTERQEVVTCYFGNNKTVKCSDRHQFKTMYGWKFVKDITSDDVIETETGTTYLKTVKRGKHEILYDIAVEQVHCYYSNGILSHNSWGLINIGAHALKKGLTVAHYTLELNAAYVGLRYDSVVTGIANQNLKHHLDDVKESVAKLAGNLIIKYYPTKSVSVTGIRAHIEKCILQNKRPDLIIVDYADLIKGNGAEKRHELEGIYEDLRGLAGEYDVPVWTASQANRSSLEEDVIDASKIAESYGKVMVADFIISLSRKLEDKLAGTGRWHVIKNRFGPDGITLPSKMNTNNGQINIYADTSIKGKETQKQMDNSNELTKKLLSRKYQEISGTDFG